MTAVRRRKGKGLERITKTSVSKVTIRIAEEKRAPEEPVLSAKFASECGYTYRTHTRVLPRFKDYKKDANLIKDYIGKVDVSYLPLCDSLLDVFSFFFLHLSYDHQ